MNACNSEHAIKEQQKRASASARLQKFIRIPYYTRIHLLQYSLYCSAKCPRTPGFGAVPTFAIRPSSLFFKKCGFAGKGEFGAGQTHQFSTTSDPLASCQRCRTGTHPHRSSTHCNSPRHKSSASFRTVCLENEEKSPRKRLA